MGATDTRTKHMSVCYAFRVQHRQLIAKDPFMGEGCQRSTARAGVTLVHDDHCEIAAESFHGMDRFTLPPLDSAHRTTGGKGENRVAGTRHLVVDHGAIRASQLRQVDAPF